MAPTRVLTVAVAALLFTAGCGGGEADTPATTTTAAAESMPTVTSPEVATAGWEPFCEAMGSFTFDENPTGGELDELEALGATVSQSAPAEISEAAQLFSATFAAAIELARSSGGELTPEHVYEVSSPQAEEAFRTVFGATVENCPAPDAG